jgi:hypothetical protein
MVGEMVEQKAKGVSRAVRRGVGGVAGETLKRTGSAVRGATSAVSHATGADAVEGVGEQVQEGAGGAAEGVREQVQEAARGAGGAAEGVGEQVQETARGAAGVAGHAGRGVAVGGGGERTVSEELREIVREAALEVIVPFARSTTKQVAKYAVMRAPQLARDTIVPKLAERLGPAIEEAGGPGAFAKGALSSISGARTGMLEKLGMGGEPQARRWQERRLPVEESIDVAARLETAYDRFTEFEEYAKFMSRGEMVDERPNERITWIRPDRVEATAVITFHRLSDRLTRVMLTYDHQPQGVLEKTTSLFGTSRRGLIADLMRFKAFVEMEPEGEYEEEPEGEEAPPAPRRPVRRRPGPRQQGARRR